MYYKLNLKALNLAMLNKGYSISRLSKECGVSKAAISRVMKDIKISRAETIYKIAKALDLEVQDLLNE